MKNFLSPRLVLIANKVAKMPFAKALLKPFYYSYKEKLKKKRSAAFHKNALTVLKQFDECLTTHNIKYFLIFGSMLGAVREKGFIGHDLDIDVAIWYDDYTPQIQKVLEQAGFMLIHSHEIDGGRLAKEDTYAKYDVSIDIFFVYNAIDSYPYICSKWQPVQGYVTKRESMQKAGYITGKRLELPLSKEIIRVPFENLMLPIPRNSHEVLKFYYGDDYLSPNNKWSEAKDFPYRKEWPEKKALYIEYE